MKSDILFELVYCSKAAPTLQSEDIDNILKIAQSFNAENNITGCLLYYSGEFAQILEGQREVVLELYERIKRDKRHMFVLLLGTEKITSRKFDGWSMAYQSLDADPNNKAEIDQIITKLKSFTELNGESSKVSELFSDVSELIITGGMVKG